ncbi:hypothetical protein [Luteolibacter marinus]|uniref:hypothetical protein n=1 Tax=Luteolibacter marinus TaxID=2776705 RepID=UPI001866BFBF|nr:hypothetical protein [Luteolibacter marinus]
MQRWIALASLVLVLLGGGVVFGYWKHKQGLPDKRYVPLAFNPDSTEEQRQASVKDLRDKLLTDVILTGIVRDCNVESKWELPSEQAAVEELKKRVIIEAGETRIKGVPTPTLNIGFSGIAAEHNDLNALAERLMEDVQRLVAPPEKKPAADPMPTSY